jgi:2-keto-4-pentenoate hydratase
MTSTSIRSASQALAQAFLSPSRLPAASLAITDAGEAYAIQTELAHALGPIAGWKVGAPHLQATPACAPMPLAGLRPSGSTLQVPTTAWRIVEVEVALRLGVDLEVHADAPTPTELAASIQDVLPLIELVDGRYAEGREAPATHRLADLQCHAAFVIGNAASIDPATLDLRTVEASLWFGGARQAHAVGGNPAPDVWHLLGWLARHCTERGLPLRRGQIITTGSCTGMHVAPTDTRLCGRVTGIGEVELRLSPL